MLKKVIFIVIFVYAGILSAQEQTLYPYFDGKQYGLTDGKDYDVVIGKVDSVSPKPIHLLDKKLYKSFDIKGAILYNAQAKVLLKGFDNYSGFRHNGLTKKLVKIHKNDLVGVYDLAKKKQVIKPKYKNVDVIIEDEIIFFKITNDTGELGILNNRYKQIVAPDKKWRGANIETIESKGISTLVIEMVDKNYDSYYMTLKGKTMKTPVIHEDILEDIVEIEDTSDEYYQNGPSCKKKDEIIITDGDYFLKSCRRTQVINLPDGYTIAENAIIHEQKNLETDYIYVLKDGKKGIYSLADKKVLIIPEFDDISKISYTYFKVKSDNKFGLFEIKKAYRAGVTVEKLAPPQFTSITKYQSSYNTFIANLEDKIEGFLVKGRKETVLYLPKKLKDQYGITF